MPLVAAFMLSGAPEEQRPLVIVQGQGGGDDPALPDRVQAHHQQAEDRQHHRDQNEGDVVAERHPLPPAEIDHVRTKALARHGGERSRRDIALLDVDEECRDGAERHAHGRAKIVVGVVADRLGEDLRGERLPAVGRAELERHAELARAGDEHDDGARQDAGRDQRQRDRERGAQQSCAGGARAVLERRVHAPQRADNEQIDQRREENAGHPDHAVDVVDIDQMAADAEIIARPAIDEADIRRGQVVPGDGADERAQEERNQVVRLEPVAPWAIGAGIDPGQRHAEKSRKHGRAGADQQRIDESLRDDAVGEKRPVVVEPPGGVEAAWIEHLEAADDQREQRQQHRRRHDHADDQHRHRFLGDQAAPAARNRRRQWRLWVLFERSRLCPVTLKRSRCFGANYWNLACHSSRTALASCAAATQSFKPSSLVFFRSKT